MNLRYPLAGLVDRHILRRALVLLALMAAVPCARRAALLGARARVAQEERPDLRRLQRQELGRRLRSPVRALQPRGRWRHSRRRRRRRQSARKSARMAAANGGDRGRHGHRRRHRRGDRATHGQDRPLLRRPLTRAGAPGSERYVGEQRFRCHLPADARRARPPASDGCRRFLLIATGAFGLSEGRTTACPGTDGVWDLPPEAKMTRR